MFIDSTYIVFVLPAIIFSFIADMIVKRVYSKYSKVDSETGMTGAEVARKIMERNEIYDIRIVRASGVLTDHFNPKTKTVCLSQEVYDSSSVAALGIAAHEIGHVIQHAEGYTPLNIRSALVPVVNISSQASWILFSAGLILDIGGLMDLGIILFSSAFIFQVLTLPVEFNASNRAVAQLADGFLPESKLNDAGRVLFAAGLTYVAAMLASLMQLVRLLVLRGRRRD